MFHCIFPDIAGISWRAFCRPCKVIFTLRKLKTVLPSLKEPVEKNLRSGIVYKIMCSHCEVCYVGKTRRHLQARVQEHLRRKGPVKTHLEKCVDGISEDSVEILGSTTKGEVHLLTLEALWIREIKPFLNTQDTMRSRDLKLTIKLWFIFFPKTCVYLIRHTSNVLYSYYIFRFLMMTMSVETCSYMSR